MKQIKGWYFPDADNFMASELSENGTYQEEHYTKAIKYVKRFRLAIDGGAHIGTWSKLMSERFEQVIAFEPSSDTVEALRANMAQFGCSNVNVLNEALSDRAEMISMTEGGPEEEARGNTGARYIIPGGAIKAVKIDSFALSNLDFLKLDIEGAEYKALLGAIRTLRSCRPVILFEDKKKTQRHFGVRREDIYRFLKSLGYERAERAGCDEIWVSQ